ncbi:MAG: hypothetical protein RLZZ399_747 [Verrucomicrobiota bacterium]|jgi:hypothetical protein
MLTLGRRQGLEGMPIGKRTGLGGTTATRSRAGSLIPHARPAYPRKPDACGHSAPGYSPRDCFRFRYRSGDKPFILVKKRLK